VSVLRGKNRACRGFFRVLINAKKGCGEVEKVVKKEISPEELGNSFCDLCKILQKAGKISIDQMRLRKE